MFVGEAGWRGAGATDRGRAVAAAIRLGAAVERYPGALGQPNRYPYPDAGVGRRDAPQHRRVEIADLCLGGAAGRRDVREARAWRDEYGVVAVERQRVDHEPVAGWHLGHERRGNDLGHVVLRFGAEVVLLGEREEAILAFGAIEFAGETGETARHAARTTVVGGGREVERTELFLEVAQESDGPVGRAGRITTLIHPPVHAHADAARGATHELPHAHCRGSRVGIRVVSALDQREKAEVFGHAARPKLRPDHRLIARAPRQPRQKLILCAVRKETDIVLDPVVRLIRSHVHVPDRIVGGTGGIDRTEHGAVAEHGHDGTDDFIGRRAISRRGKRRVGRGHRRGDWRRRGYRRRYGHRRRRGGHRRRRGYGGDRSRAAAGAGGEQP